MIEDIKFPGNEIAQEKYDALRKRLLERARVLEEAPKQVAVFEKTGNPYGLKIARLIDCFVVQCNDFYEIVGMVAKRNNQLESENSSLKDEVLEDIKVLVERINTSASIPPTNVEKKEMPSTNSSINNTEIKIPPKTYTCSICGSIFTTTVALAQHVHKTGHKAKKIRHRRKHSKSASKPVEENLGNTSDAKPTEEKVVEPVEEKESVSE